MLHYLFICCMIASVNSLVAENASDDDIYPLRRESFVTKQDHFSPQDGNTGKFNYTVNPRHFVQNSPIFININTGEVDEIVWLYRGLTHEISEIEGINALVINFNVRYFGTNQPTLNSSFENLQYLTVEQSLADISTLITAVKESYNSSNSRVILSGSGYGGTLAVWARQRYPHLVYGVWASSGMFEFTMDTKQIFESLTQTIREYGGNECASNINDAFEEMEEHLYDVLYIQDIFKLCTYLLHFYPREVAGFFNGLIHYIIDYVNANNGEGILMLCSAMNVSDVPSHVAFAKWVTATYATEKCLDFDYDKRVNRLRNVSWDTNEGQSGEKQRLYLQCTQLGTMPTTVNGDTLFGRTIAQNYYYSLCRDVFGVNYVYENLRRTVKQLNIKHGGKDPQVTKVFYTNGVLDPNYAFGITQDKNGDKPWNIINSKYCGKSSEYWENSEDDSDIVKATKESVINAIKGWCEE